MTRLLCVVAIVGCLATSVSTFGEELEIPHTRVATAGMSGGFQCANGPGINYNPSIIQAASCSLNTLTYTYSGRRVGLFDFNLSAIPEEAEVLDAYIRLQGVCCYGNTEWFELIMLPGTGSFNLAAANQVYNTSGDIVSHPPTIPNPGFSDYTVSLDLIENIRSGSNWLLIGIDRSGTFTNLAAEATLHVSYSTGPPCDGDLNGDDIVDGTDLSLVLGYWGMASTEYDLDGDGYITGADLTILLGSWGACPTGE